LIKANFDLGLKDYPLYQEEHRKELNDKIIEHFYFREIGLQTPELFKRFLNRKMNEIMPYYNQLYKSEDVKFNPLYNVEMTETYEHKSRTDGTSNVNAESNQSTNSKDKSSSSGYVNGSNITDNHVENIGVKSDTPQSNLSIEDIKNNKYASETQYDHNDIKNNETSNQTSSNEINSEQNAAAESKSNSDMSSVQNVIDSFIRKTEGSSAGLPFSKALKQWREIMLNIDMMIIEELDPLFMQIY